MTRSAVAPPAPRRRTAEIIAVMFLFVALLTPTVLSAAKAAAASLPLPPPSGAVIVNDGSDPGGNLPAACGTPAYTDIQQAVAAVPTGSTVYVCAGTYVETNVNSIIISDDLVLDGAQYGVDAVTGRVDPTQETIIDAAGAANGQAISYNPPGIPTGAPGASTGTIDGFTIENAAGRAVSASGNGGSGYTWVDNIIADNPDFGLYFNTGTAPDPPVTLIEGNRFTGNGGSIWLVNGPGGSYAGDDPANNVTISGNAFSDNLNNDINTPGSELSSLPDDNTIITDNRTLDDVSFLLLINTDNATVDDNTIAWSDPSTLPNPASTPTWGIMVAAGNNGVIVQGNTLSGSYTAAANPLFDNEWGIALSASFPDAGDGPSTGVDVDNNTLSGQAVGITAYDNPAVGIGADSGFVIDDNNISDSVLAGSSSCGTDAGGYYHGGVGIWIQDHNWRPGSTQSGVVQNTGYAVENNTVTGSACSGIWVQRFGPNEVNIGGTFAGNHVNGSGTGAGAQPVEDCRDDSLGVLTAGTADTWSTDGGLTSLPPGLCVPAAPAPPSDVVATVSLLPSSPANEALVSWTAPAPSDGQVSAYIVQPVDQTAGTTSAAVTVTGSPPGTSVTLTGLIGGHAYAFTVTATGPGGSSTPSASNAVLPVNQALAASVSSLSTVPPSGTLTTATLTIPTTLPGAITTTLSATATGTPGSPDTITVAAFATNPTSVVVTGGAYFDVAISPGNSFGTLAFQVCGVPAGGLLQWWQASTQSYETVTDQTAPSGALSCVTVTVTPATSPSLADMDGTVFVVNPPSAVVPNGNGYSMIAADGGIFTFGDAIFYGSTGDMKLNEPIVGMVTTPDDKGYWLVASDGGIFTFGDAGYYGSTGGVRLNKPIVAMAATPDGGGYWLVASDGGIFTFGDAGYYGSTGAVQLNKPIVGMTATPDGGGYWLVASDGGIITFGDAVYYGSAGAARLNKPIVGMTVTPEGGGYWLVASDGGIFAFGDATFFGSTGSLKLNQPIVGMTVTPDGGGYWLVASDGGIFAFGDATFFGSTGSLKLNQPMVGMS